MAEMITFDEGKCIRCGVCTEVCPVGIIELKDHNIPCIPENLYSICRKCGHCEVFCPEGAVSSDYAGNIPSERDLSGKFLEPDELKEHLWTRRTTRVFRENLVEKEKLEEILDAVRYAPSGSNRQPVRWVVISGREKVTEIADKVAKWMASLAEKEKGDPMAEAFGQIADLYSNGIDRITRNAPQLILTMVPSDNPWGQTDSTIALSWFEILCQSYGIGTCWLGLVRMPAREDPSILAHLPVPRGYELGFSMAFGYARYIQRGIPKRNKADITWI